MSYFENMRMSIEGTQIAAAVDKETERANVRALGVRFVSAEPSINMLNSFNKLPNMFPLFQSVIPKPEAFITLRNIGKHVISNYTVRTAIIISPRLAARQEEQLFTRRPEWQTGGAVGGSWNPGETKAAHTRYGEFFQPSDWPEILAGNKVFYVLTTSYFSDDQGSLPTTESCTWWSITNHEQKSGWCWGHNS